MAARRRLPVLLPTRVTKAERAMIDAVAAAENVTVTELIRGIVLPIVGERVARHASQFATR